MAHGKLSRAKLPKEARELVASCREFLRLLDEEMKNPSSVERGRRLGRLATALEMRVDAFEHFGMPSLYRTIESLKTAAKKRAEG